MTILPIFNDEAIYLDWGWRETHFPGGLYYSLYDGKQPLLMWIFGISESIFSDPLFAGRIVSVLTGFLTLSGIYLISETLFNKKAAIISALLYIPIPIFMFFDRQALMESAIAAVGILSCYFLLKFISTNVQKYAYCSGLFLGLGYFVKSSALVFIATYFILIFIVLIKSTKKTENIKHLGIVACIIIATVFFLLINPQFWSTLSMNSRFSFTIQELFSFPLNSWIKNAQANLLISFFYLTPFIFLSSIAGIYHISRTGKIINLIFILWIIISLMIQTVSVRGTGQRYLVSFLAPLLIPAGYFFQTILDKKRVVSLFFLVFSLLIPSIFSYFLIFSPPLYFSIMGKLHPYSQNEYLEGFTSGYGIVDIKNYIETNSRNDNVFVGLALNTGNPESAILAYFRNNDRIKVTYFDSVLFGNRLDNVDCISMPVKFYFVSRNDQQANLNKFFIKLKSFKNPYSNYSINIYSLKKPCQGKTLNIDL